MKVLRIYDHLGELKKEFNVYVEGEDFKWQASVPECLWLGTVILEELGNGSKPEPTPEVVAEEPEPEVTKPKTNAEMLVEVLTEEIKETKKAEEVKREPKKVHRKRRGVKGTSPSDYLKSIKVLRQDDSGRDTNQGD